MTYRDAGLATWGSYQYTCYWDADTYLVIGKRQGQGAWTLYRYDGNDGRPSIQAPTPLDNHDSCVIAIDNNGYLHLSYGQHNDPLNYRRSDGVMGSWTGGLTAELSMVASSVGEARVAYPTFTQDPDGKLYFLYRGDGVAGQADTYFYAYNAATQVWSAAVGTSTGGKLYDGLNSVPDQNFYHYGAPRFDDDFGSGGFMHLAGHWRTGPHDGLEGGVTDHDIGYAKWNGTNWYKANGSAQTIPITLANCEIFDPSPEESGIAGMNAIECDGDGNPHVVYIRNDASGWGQIFYAYHDGVSWTVAAITSQTVLVSEGNEPLTPIHKPEIAIDKATDTLYVFYAAMGATGPGIIMHTSAVGSGLWTEENISSVWVAYNDGLTYDYALWRSEGILDIYVAPYRTGQDALPIYVLRYEP